MTKGANETQQPANPDPLEKLRELQEIDRQIAALAPTRRHSTDTTQKLQAQLQMGQRDAFIEEVAAALDTRPSLKALKLMAEEDPEKHARYTALYAKLAGVSERVEITNSAEAMSDAELMDFLLRNGWSPPDKPFPHQIEGEKTDD